MTKEEYAFRMGDLEEMHIVNKKHLMEEYAFANNPYSIGDIIEDHFHIIRVEKIRWRNASIGEEYPSCVYVGTELKKDLTPKKKQDSTSMHQVNVKRKIK